MLKCPLRATAALLAVAGLCAVAAACPFCPVTAPTLAEQQAQSDYVLLAQWVGGDPNGGDDASYTHYEALQVLKSPGGKLRRGERVKLVPYYEGKRGNLFLLMGKLGEKPDDPIRWDAPQEITETGWQYVAQAPSTESAPEKRLAYFQRFLEYPDDFIAGDAFAEFSRAKYEDVAPLVRKLSPERVRRWLDSPRTPRPRLGFYGMLLGLCGTAEDARKLEARILDPTADRNDTFKRLGIDGFMGGYLLLTGADGLEAIDRAILNDPKAPVGEVYAAMSALRFLWTYGEGRIEKDRLRQSMRQLLDREEVTDLAITDLARWKDWAVQDRLGKMFESPSADPTTRRAIREAITAYMLAATRDVPQDGQPPEHATRGRHYLDTFRTTDPLAVRNAERRGS